MIPILDFQERSLTGPVMKTTDFDIAFSKVLRELVDTYEIRYDPNDIVVDEKTADAVFQAGVALLAEVGLYHLDTQRVIQLSREEILEIAREYREDPPEPVFGRGEDRFSVRYRTADDGRPPVLAAGPTGPVEQDWFAAYARSFAQEPQVRALGIVGGLAAVDGREPRVGTLDEMYCAQWECERLVEMLQQVGRPRMHLGLLGTASSVAAIMACMRPGLREPHNTQIGIHIIPEQKIDWSRLILAKFCEDRGIVPWTSCVSVMGALSRDGVDAAVAATANLLGQLAYGHGSLASVFINRMDGSYGDPEGLWAFSAVCRASERHIRVPIAGICAGDLAVGRRAACMYKAAAIALSSSATGLGYAWIAGGSGLEACLLHDVMTAGAGMNRERVAELVRVIFAVVEEETKVSSGLQHFPEVYDLKTLQPRPDYRDVCARVKDGLADLGVPLLVP